MGSSPAGSRRWPSPRWTWSPQPWTTLSVSVHADQRHRSDLRSVVSPVVHSSDETCGGIFRFREGCGQARLLGPGPGHCSVPPVL